MKFWYETTPRPSGGHDYVVLRDDAPVSAGHRSSNAEATVAAKEDMKLARLFLGESYD
jgi:hypothetical protein